MWPYTISALPLQLLYKAQVEYHQTSHLLSFQLPLSLPNLRYLKTSKLFLRPLGHWLHAQWHAWEQKQMFYMWQPHINNGLSPFTAVAVPEMVRYQWFFSCVFGSFTVAMVLLQAMTYLYPSQYHRLLQRAALCLMLIGTENQPVTSSQDTTLSACCICIWSTQPCAASQAVGSQWKPQEAGYFLNSVLFAERHYLLLMAFMTDKLYYIFSWPSK